MTIYDTTAKQSMYNNSDYAQRLAEKQAIFNSSQYGQTQALVSGSDSTSSTSKTYTLADGRVYKTTASSDRIDFRSLFGSIGSDAYDADSDDTTEDDTDTLNLISNMKSSADSWMDAYTAMSKQKLGLS